MSDNKSFSEVLERFRDIAFYESFDMIVAIANGGISFSPREKAK